jgi:hypothetical protein
LADPLIELFLKDGLSNIEAWPQFLQHWTRIAASTASMFRVVQFSGYVFPYVPVAVGGTSGAATVSALGAVGAGAVPVMAMAGVFVALGAGYYEARQMARKSNALIGFAEGFVMGVLKWNWAQAWSHFGKKEVGTNAWDQGISVAAYEGYNSGLKTGFGMGSALPENAKKAYRIKLRNLADIHGSGRWSRNSDEAYLQQRNYVIELAGAGVRNGVIKAE